MRTSQSIWLGFCRGFDLLLGSPPSFQICCTNRPLNQTCPFTPNPVCSLRRAASAMLFVLANNVPVWQYMQEWTDVGILEIFQDGHQLLWKVGCKLGGCIARWGVRGQKSLTSKIRSDDDVVSSLGWRIAEKCRSSKKNFLTDPSNGDFSSSLWELQHGRFFDSRGRTGKLVPPARTNFSRKFRP